MPNKRKQLKKEVRISNVHRYMAMPKFQISFFPTDKKSEENQKRVEELEAEVEMLNALMTNEKILRQDLENQVQALKDDYQEKTLHYQTKMSDKQSKYRTLQQQAVEMKRTLKKQDEQLEDLREKQTDMEHQQTLLQYESEIEQLTKDEKVLSSEADLLLQIDELTTAFEMAQASAANYREKLSLQEDKVEAVMHTNDNTSAQSTDVKDSLFKKLSKTNDSRMISDNVQQVGKRSTAGDNLTPDLLDWARQKEEIDLINKGLDSLQNSESEHVQRVKSMDKTVPDQLKTEESKESHVRVARPRGRKGPTSTMEGQVMEETERQQVTMQTPKRKGRKVRTLTFDTYGVLS